MYTNLQIRSATSALLGCFLQAAEVKEAALVQRCTQAGQQLVAKQPAGCQPSQHTQQFLTIPG
jgi:hypothetical protein